MKWSRYRILQLVVIAAFAVIAARLFYIQVIDSSYKMSADNNVLRYMVQYPPRGEVYDRNGEFLVQSKEAYDLMVTPREVHDLDTLLMSRILEIPVEQLREELAKAIETTTFKTPVCPVYQNVTALPSTDPDTIKKNLLAQLTSPVKWTQTVKNMIADGAGYFMEIGPGNVLQGLVKKIAGTEVTIEGITTL